MTCYVTMYPAYVIVLAHARVPVFQRKNLAMLSGKVKTNVIGWTKKCQEVQQGASEGPSAQTWLAVEEKHG